MLTAPWDNPEIRPPIQTMLRDLLMTNPERLLISGPFEVIVQIQRFHATAYNLVIPSATEFDAATQLKNAYPKFGAIPVVCIREFPRLCLNCREEADPKYFSYALREYFGLVPEDLSGVQLYRFKGCKECGHSGAQGLFPIFEILLPTERIQSMLEQDTSAEDLRHAAREQGMVTMLEQYFSAILEGQAPLIPFTS